MGALPTGKAAWACGAAVLGWTVWTVLAEPWPDGPTHEVAISKYGALQVPELTQETPAPSVQPMRASGGVCEINVSLGTEHQVKPGSLVLLFADPGAPPVAVAEVLLSRPQSSNAKLAGWWPECPPLREVRRSRCSEAADALIAVRPRADRAGPEEAAAWDDALADLVARAGCSGWTPPPERPRIPGVDDY